MGFSHCKKNTNKYIKIMMMMIIIIIIIIIIIRRRRAIIQIIHVIISLYFIDQLFKKNLFLLLKCLFFLKLFTKCINQCFY